jgi:hypothetical protein
VQCFAQIPLRLGYKRVCVVGDAVASVAIAFHRCVYTANGCVKLPMLAKSCRQHCCGSATNGVRVKTRRHRVARFLLRLCCKRVCGVSRGNCFLLKLRLNCKRACVCGVNVTETVSATCSGRAANGRVRGTRKTTQCHLSHQTREAVFPSRRRLLSDQ